MERTIAALGGRKQANGYLAALLLTAAAVWMHASFVEYAATLLGTLGLTSGAHTVVDVAKVRAEAAAAADAEPPNAGGAR